jgi:hypothetical protein
MELPSIAQSDMSDRPSIIIAGLGAVSPAGWGVPAFRNALAAGQPVASKQIARPGWPGGLTVRQVPPPSPRPPFLAHARLRRTSPVAQHAVGAAVEALGDHATKVAAGELRLGIVFCTMSACVNYSRRFYDEVLKDPATASPLVFPETVYNSPASHLGALLGTTAINYTLVGDPGTFLQGLALAADWLDSDRVDGCLVVGAEEDDWLTADAMHLFDRKSTLSDGAGALYLRKGPATGARLRAITGAHLFAGQSRSRAAQRARAELPAAPGRALLCDGLQGMARADEDEAAAWADWRGDRLSVKKIFGEGLMAAAAWQCVAAVDALNANRCESAAAFVVGCNQQAIAAQFVKG